MYFVEAVSKNKRSNANMLSILKPEPEVAL